MKFYVHKYVAHTPELMPHLVIALVFVSQSSCGDLFRGLAQFGITLLLLAAHFLACGYIYADLCVVPTRFWPCVFDLCFPVFLSLVMCS